MKTTGKQTDSPPAWKMNKREAFMLWKLLEFPLHRYLLTFARKQGFERAERHIEIAKTIWEVYHCKTASPAHHEEWMAIHDLIADKITDHLPRTIGFDLDADESEHNWDILVDKLFRRIVALEIAKATGGAR